jgi:hypothetical protein
MARTGRPSTYPSDPAKAKALCERVIALGAEGKSVVQISADPSVNTPKTTMLRWGEDHADFRTALARAKELEQVWWEQVGAKNLSNREFNASLWMMNVKSRFRSEYGDRVVQEHVGKDGGPIQHEERQAVEIIEGMLNTVASRLPSTPAPAPTSTDAKLH